MVARGAEGKKEVVAPWGREEGKAGGDGGGGRGRRAVGGVCSDKQEDTDHPGLLSHHNNTIQVMRKESEPEGYLRTRAIPQANEKKKCKNVHKLTAKFPNTKCSKLKRSLSKSRWKLT